MGAAQSGNERAARTRQSADAMEAEARALLARAERTRTVAGAIEAGNEGERAIGELLDRLTGEGWAVLHDRRKLATSPANLDHVAIGPGGVFVIDAKNWSGGRIRLDERGMAVGRWRKDDELHAAKVDADIVREVVAATWPHLPTTGVIAFAQDMGLADAQQHRGVVVVQREHLLATLRAAAPVLGPPEVQAVTARLQTRFPPRAAATRVRRTAPAPAPRGAAGHGHQPPTRPATRPAIRPATGRPAERPAAQRRLLKVAVVLACLPALPWALELVVSR